MIRIFYEQMDDKDEHRYQNLLNILKNIHMNIHLKIYINIYVDKLNIFMNIHEQLDKLHNEHLDTKINIFMKIHMNIIIMSIDANIYRNIHMDSDMNMKI